MSTMPYDFSVNDRFTSEVRHVGHERQPVLVVDDYLANPRSMVQYAAEEVDLRPAPSMYPGIVAATPTPYVHQLSERLAHVLGGVFGVDPRSFHALHSFFGIVTTPRADLKWLQRMPHVDSCNPRQFAVLHYLCDGSQGGTAFYRFRATGWESLDQARHTELHRLVAQATSVQPADYITTDDSLYEQTGRIEARFNRLIVYRSRLLHSGQIGPATVLNPSPRVGRLTANTFVRFEPAATPPLA